MLEKQKTIPVNSTTLLAFPRSASAASAWDSGFQQVAEMWSSCSNCYRNWNSWRWQWLRASTHHTAAAVLNSTPRHRIGNMGAEVRGFVVGSCATADVHLVEFEDDFHSKSFGQIDVHLADVLLGPFPMIFIKRDLKQRPFWVTGRFTGGVARLRWRGLTKARSESSNKKHGDDTNSTKKRGPWPWLNMT